MMRNRNLKSQLSHLCHSIIKKTEVFIWETISDVWTAARKIVKTSASESAAAVTMTEAAVYGLLYLLS